MDFTKTFGPHGIDLTAPGGIDKLLAFHRSAFGNATMSVDTGDISAPPANAFTEAQLQDAIKNAVETARAQEKDKLYGRLSKAEEGWKAVQEELASQRTAREQAEKSVEDARKAAEAEIRAKAEAEMDVRQLLEVKQSEWQKQLAEREQSFEQKLQSLQAERESERATLEMERKFTELREYTQRRVADEKESIAPELLDFVSGNTTDEIEASINTVKAKSLAIVEAMQAAAQQQRAQMRGVAPTGYSTTGPLDTNSTTKTYSAEDLRGMSMNDYAKVRGSLLGGMAQRSNQGLFG